MAVSPPATTLGDIVAKMGFDLGVDEARRDGTLELTLDGPDRKRLTAHDGELLSALEFLLNRMGRRAWPDEPRCFRRGFRSERDNELVVLVREAAAGSRSATSGSTR
jgi:predicted RNA-binding protein Jag